MGICRLVEKESTKLLVNKLYQLIFNIFDQDLRLINYMRWSQWYLSINIQTILVGV